MPKHLRKEKTRLIKGLRATASFDANCDIWGTVFFVESIIFQSEVGFLALPPF
jgi:hypothetical protein